MWRLVIRSAAPVTQSHLSKTWRSDAPKATHLRKPVSCATRHASLQILFQRPTPAIFQIATKSSRFARFWQGPESIAFATQATSELHFWCASRHNGVHFFDISTSNSGPRTGGFERRNVLCAHFNKSTSKSAPTLRCFYHFGFHTCSHHWGVQFLIFHPARWLRARRFSELTFGPSGSHKNIGRTQCFATFLPFRARWSSFFWLFLFSDSSHHCYASVHNKSEV